MPRELTTDDLPEEPALWPITPSHLALFPDPKRERLNCSLDGSRVETILWLCHLLDTIKDLNRDAIYSTPRTYKHTERITFTWAQVSARLHLIADTWMRENGQRTCPSPRGMVDNLGVVAAYNINNFLSDVSYVLYDADDAFPLWLASRYNTLPGLPSHDTSGRGGGVLRYFDMPWEEREQLRFDTKLYLPVPWHVASSYVIPAQLARGDRPAKAEETIPLAALAPIPGHYVHVNPADPSQVRYCENAEKAARHIYIVSKPGRYLSKFYPTLDPGAVRAWQAVVDQSSAIQFAETSADCVKIYMTGPASCMDGRHGFTTENHPAQVYGGESDVTIAYMTDMTGRPIARAVCWQAKKRYGRIYGDSDRMKPRMEALGYQQKDIEGAKVNAVYRGKSRSLYMPYIDAVAQASLSDCGKFVILDDCGPIQTRHTDGETDPDGVTCTNCNECVAEDDATYHDGEVYCESCRDDCLHFCDHLGEYTTEETETVRVPRNRSGSRRSPFYEEQWGAHARERHAYYCDGSEQYYSDTHPRVDMHDGETWSQEYFSDNGWQAWDGENYRDGDGPKDRRDADKDTYEADARSDPWTKATREAYRLTCTEGNGQ